MSVQKSPTSRRVSNSCIVRYLYTAVKTINRQRQAANLTRICKYMQRYHGIKKADCIVEIELCVRDGLLVWEQSVSKNGSKKGALQEKCTIPNKDNTDAHDWYCFECHRCGDVVCCSSCHRVFHPNCIKDVFMDKFKCYVCRGRSERVTISNEKLNRLLGFLCKSLRDLVPDKLQKWKKMESDKVLMNALLYRHMDLYTVQQKTFEGVYKHWVEFRADTQNFLHNVFIYYGENNSFTQAIAKMFSYCVHDIEEIEVCADCYEASSIRNDENWFCRPCKPLHKLVYAKLSNSPYWPAKVIKQFDNKFDVRFFGSGHTRAVVPKARVKIINPNIQHIKSFPMFGHTPSWKRALAELKLHVMCIGPQVILKRLPVNFKLSNILENTCPNSTRVVKRKGNNDSSVEKKKIRFAVSAEQQSESEDFSNLHVPFDTRTYEQQTPVADTDEDTDVSERTDDSVNLGNEMELEREIISEFNEDGDIKNEDEIQNENRYFSGLNSKSVELEDSRNKNYDGLNQLDNGQSTIGNVGKQCEINVSDDVHNIDDCSNQSDDLQNKTEEEQEHILEKQENILAESVIVKEEPLCVQCSSLGLISRKDAERMRDEAVAKVTKHFEETIAQMQEQCSQQLEDCKKVCPSSCVNKHSVILNGHEVFCNCSLCNKRLWQEQPAKGSGSAQSGTSEKVLSQEQPAKGSRSSENSTSENVLSQEQPAKCSGSAESL